jgi:hypothetical protein
MGDDESRIICLPGSEVPNWFSHKEIGSSISFHVPSISKGQFIRLLLCFVYSFFEGSSFIVAHYSPRMQIKNKTRGNWKDVSFSNYSYPRVDGENGMISPKRKEEDHFFLYLMPLLRNKYELESGLIFNESVMESGDEIEVSFGLSTIYGNVKKCGVHVVVEEPNVM